MRFAYQVVVNVTTEGTFKCVHCVMTETHAWISTPHEFPKHCGFWRNFQPVVLFVSIHSATYFIVFPVLVILHFVFSLSEESAVRLCSALCFSIYLDC